MGNYRIYVEKKEKYQVETSTLINDLNENLNLNIEYLRLINIYDIFNIDDTLLDKVVSEVLSDKVTDNVYSTVELDKYIAYEYLPGQFDQRADSAMQCVSLISPDNNVSIKSGTLVMLDVEDSELNRVKEYLINRIECQEKDLSILETNKHLEVEDVNQVPRFIELDEFELLDFRNSLNLAMSIEDLLYIQSYFKDEVRNPTETEIRVLDTYWSDHCRHTTFETLITNVEFSSDKFNEQIKKSFNDYISVRNELGINRPITLMDLATINAKYERLNGNLDDLEISDEINACSIYIDVDVEGKLEKWLLMFKNETHNHPTEIEPFGGASTCVGGAIRDPLSGRSFVYQGVRVSGACDPTMPIEDTIEGKLPQRVISKKACEGFSSYGNQIGLATTHVREIYHPGFLAKRMEAGAVVGAAPLGNVKREKTALGDVVIMLGGRTGRDGIGGATGSSKVHNEDSVKSASSEVQKGNAPEERKIQRLFRNISVTKLIKKANDFGAGGVSVAIGELADSIEIDLDKVKTKYRGLNATELAISESQERMAVVIDYIDKEKFISLCENENIEAYQVAKVTDTKRLIMKYKGKVIVDISREFLNTNGVRAKTDAVINPISNEPPFKKVIKGKTLKDKILNSLNDLNVASQKGLIEHFDSTVGASTVIMPLGGEHQLTEAQSSVQKIPVLHGETTTASIMTFGYNPYISEWSPYHGAMYSVIESLSKIVASGGNFKNVRFSFQEYFERMVDKTSFGKPLASLLGAFDVLKSFNLAAIGGKDSMSGTYKDICVPPTLISFAVTTESVDNIISNELKQKGNYLYLIKHDMVDYLPNIEQLKENFNFIYKNKNLVSAHAIEFGGLVEGLIKMSLGNKLGFKVNTKEDLFSYNYGSIIVESNEKLEYKNALYLGEVTEELHINDVSLDHDELLNSLSKLEKVFPVSNNMINKTSMEKNEISRVNQARKLDEVQVLVPVFPGMNSEYDMIRAFERAGGVVKSIVFKNQNKEDILASINELSQEIESSNILAFSGGFSLGDEPDGSGKFIASILNNEDIKESIKKFLDNDGLILGICNGFQALIKAGLFSSIDTDVTLYKNDINRHISKIATTKVTTSNSPWLRGFNVGDVHKVPISHGEGKFVVDKKSALELFSHDQVAFQYLNENPNGSSYEIEGIISRCGRILGKMGHSERYNKGLYKNIPNIGNQNIFKNAVDYFRGM